VLVYDSESSSREVVWIMAVEHYCTDGACGRTLFHDILNLMFNNNADSFPPGPGYMPMPSDWAVRRCHAACAAR